MPVAARKLDIFAAAKKKNRRIYGVHACDRSGVHRLGTDIDDSETRLILKFLWPEKSKEIDKVAVTTDLRRFAQKLLIAAVEGSYAMSWLDVTFRTVVRPGAGVKALLKKLASRYARHWYKHTTQKDLMDAKIYVSVRNQLASTLKPGWIPFCMA
jgi:hypothetical protein